MHLGAHAVNTGRLYATARISGVLGILWAIPSGLFLTLGGAQQLTLPAWQQLLGFVSELTLERVPPEECYRIIGGTLLAGGLLGLLGLIWTVRSLSLASAAICTVWCATLTGFLGMSNVNVEDGGNFLAFSAALNTAVFLLRFVLLVGAPDPERSVQIYDRG